MGEIDLSGVVGAINDLGETASQIVSQDWRRYTTKNVDAVLKEGLSKALVEAGAIAINSIEEFKHSSELMELFLENLADPQHIKISNGQVISVFNERVGGTEEDLISGWEQAGGHTGTEGAPIIWKYGIYLPSVQGATPDPKSKAGKFYNKYGLTYQDIVGLRAIYWSPKAPFWYFIEYGNASSGRAYPTFAGTGFISTLEVQARRVAKDLRDLYLATLVDNLGEVVKKYFTESEALNIALATGRTIKASRIVLRDLSIRQYINDTGEIFYEIGTGHRRIKYSEFLGILLRKLRGH